MDLFTLVARLGMDSSEYERGISQARGSFNQLGDFISAKAVAIGTMAANAIEKATNAAVNFGKSAVLAAADYQSETALFRHTFGELQGSAEKSFSAIEKSTGVLASRLKSVGTKAFVQFKGAGLDGVEALDMMEEYTGLAADAATAFNITLEEADEKLRSFLRGNTEAGNSINLFTSQTQRNTYALEKYGQKWTDLTEAQKQMLMLDVVHDIYEQSEVLGQAGRESKDFNVQLANLKKSWKDAKGIFGAPIMAAITPYLQDASDFLNNEAVQLKLDQLGLAIGDAINATVDFILNIPDADDIAYMLNTWWDNVKASLNPFSATATVKVQKVEESLKTGGIGSAFSTAVDEAWWNPANWGEMLTTKTSAGGTTYTPTDGGKGAKGWAVGLDYVPYNDFYARLHEGEAVLTKAEATDWRAGNASGMDTALLNDIRSLLQVIADKDTTIMMDGQTVGNLVTETVSRNIANRARSLRYSV